MERFINLDFSKPRLRVNGKSVSKFDVARLIDSVNPYANSVICMSAYDYSELKEWLLNVLYKRNCRGIYGEKFNIVAL